MTERFKLETEALCMNEHGYEEELEKNIHVVETTCASCRGAAKFTTMKITDVEPEEVVCVFRCEGCGDKSVSFFDQTYDKRGGVRIECNFDDPKDLQREINLNQLASVEIVSEGFSYKYEGSSPGVYNVEAILRQAEDEIKNLCGKGDITSGAHGKIIRETGVPEEECEEKLRKVQGLMRNPRFKMVIEDQFGLSRVAPVGRGVFELQNTDICSLDDEKVRHVFKKTE